MAEVYRYRCYYMKPTREIQGCTNELLLYETDSLQKAEAYVDMIWETEVFDVCALDTFTETYVYYKRHKQEVLKPHEERYGVHLTHCCPGCCKYGQDDICPVSNEVVPPKYKCEDCTCEHFNPIPEPDKWWNSLSQDQKELAYKLYLDF
jgi:hypothetical protein